MKNNLHPLQSDKWGEFREKTGIKVIKENNLLITIHPVPHTNFNIGYLPKGPAINKEMLSLLKSIGEKENCIFIQIEPNVVKTNSNEYKFNNLYKSARPLFTNFTFILDLTKTEEEILKNMDQKTRYNIRLAEKKDVKVLEDNSEDAFGDYLKLTEETTKRQNFYAHSQNYHKLMWQTLKENGQGKDKENLTAHLLKATYNGDTLATWILFVLGDTLYYPYGASSTKNREVMASNLMMWEAIKFGKRLGLKQFDMWGAMGFTPDKKDPWYGFHRFKEGYGPKHVEYIGSYDFVIKTKWYTAYKIANKIRWFILRFK